MNLLQEMQRLFQEGLLGHAYLCVGNPLEEGKAFAGELAQILLSGSGEKEADPGKLRHRIETRSHPDVHWVEPRGKLRQIKVEDLKTTLKRIHEKSFEGGWKIVVFLAAERLNPSSGNQLLKSLEEPPACTLILLVSDAPEQILDTLRSRCQTLHLPRDLGREPVWKEDLLRILRDGPPRNLRARLERAARFRDFFESAAQQYLEAEEELGAAEESGEDVEEDVEKARMSDARRKMQRAILSAVEEWYRDVQVCRHSPESSTLCYPEEREFLRQQAETLPPASITKLLANVRNSARRLEGNLPVQVVLEQFVF
ncbi:MAG: hypothetical protein ACO3N7_04190 [Kiritimatiellia bacterium]